MIVKPEILMKKSKVLSLTNKKHQDDIFIDLFGKFSKQKKKEEKKKSYSVVEWFFF